MKYKLFPIYKGTYFQLHLNDGVIEIESRYGNKITLFDRVSSNLWDTIYLYAEDLKGFLESKGYVNVKVPFIYNLKNGVPFFIPLDNTVPELTRDGDVLEMNELPEDMEILRNEIQMDLLGFKIQEGKKITNHYFTSSKLGEYQRPTNPNRDLVILEMERWILQNALSTYYMTIAMEGSAEYGYSKDEFHGIEEKYIMAVSAMFVNYFRECSIFLKEDSAKMPPEFMPNLNKIPDKIKSEFLGGGKSESESLNILRQYTLFLWVMNPYKEYKPLLKWAEKFLPKIKESLILFCE